MPNLFLAYRNNADCRIASSVMYEFFTYSKNKIDNVKFDKVYCVSIADNGIASGAINCSKDDVIVIVGHNKYNYTIYGILYYLLTGAKVYWISNDDSDLESILSKSVFDTDSIRPGRFDYFFNRKKSNTWLAYTWCINRLVKNGVLEAPLREMDFPDIIKLVDGAVSSDTPGTTHDLFYMGLGSNNFNGKNFFRNISSGNQDIDIFNPNELLKKCHNEYIATIVRFGQSIQKYNDTKRSSLYDEYGFIIYLYDDPNTKHPDDDINGTKIFCMNSADKNVFTNAIKNMYDMVITFVYDCDGTWDYHITSTNGKINALWFAETLTKTYGITEYCVFGDHEHVTLAVPNKFLLGDGRRFDLKRRRHDKCKFIIT